MARLSALIFILVGTVFAGICVTAIVSVPSLFDSGASLIPITAMASYVIAIPVSWLLARSIMAQTTRTHIR